MDKISSCDSPIGFNVQIKHIAALNFHTSTENLSNFARTAFGVRFAYDFSLLFPGTNDVHFSKKVSLKRAAVWSISVTASSKAQIQTRERCPSSTSLQAIPRPMILMKKNWKRPVTWCQCENENFIPLECSRWRLPHLSVQQIRELSIVSDVIGRRVAVLFKDTDVFGCIFWELRSSSAVSSLFMEENKLKIATKLFFLSLSVFSKILTVIQ